MFEFPGHQNIFEFVANEPLIIEKRQDFYRNPFMVAVTSEEHELQSDKLLTSEFVDILKKILNAK